MPCMCHKPIKALLLEPCEPLEGGDSACLGALEPLRPATQGLVGVPELEEPRHLLLHRMAQCKVAVAVKDRIQALGLLGGEASAIGEKDPSCALEPSVGFGFEPGGGIESLPVVRRGRACRGGLQCIGLRLVHSGLIQPNCTKYVPAELGLHVVAVVDYLGVGQMPPYKDVVGGVHVHRNRFDLREILHVDAVEEPLEALHAPAFAHP